MTSFSKRSHLLGRVTLGLAAAGILAGGAVIAAPGASATPDPDPTSPITVELEPAGSAEGQDLYRVMVTNQSDRAVSDVEAATSVPASIRGKEQAAQPAWTVGSLSVGETLPAQADGRDLVLHLIPAATPPTGQPDDGSTQAPGTGDTDGQPDGGSTQAPGTGDTDHLAKTGSNVGPMIALGLVFLVGGASLAWAANRRRGRVLTSLGATVGALALAAVTIGAPPASAAESPTGFEAESPVTVGGVDYTLKSSGSFRYAPDEVTEEMVVSGRALDPEHEPMGEAALKFTHQSDGTVVEVETDDEGYFSTRLQTRSRYSVSGPGLESVLTTTTATATPSVEDEEGMLELGRAVEDGSAELEIRSDVFLVNATSTSIDGTSAETLDQGVRVGDLVAAFPEPDSGDLATTGRVVSLEVNGPVTVLTLEPAPAEELADSLLLPDRILSADEAIFIPAEGVEDVSRTRGFVASQTYDWKLKVDDVTATVHFELEGAVEPSADINFRNLAASKVSLENRLTAKSSTSVKVQDSRSKTMQVGFFKLPMLGGFVSVDVPVSIVLSADGEIDVTTDLVAGFATTVAYENGDLSASDDSTLTAQVGFRAAAVLEAGVRVDATLTVGVFLIGDVGLITLRAQPGVQLDANGEVTVSAGGDAKPVDANGSLKLYGIFKAWYQIPLLTGKPEKGEEDKGFESFGKNPLLQFLIYQWPSEGGESGEGGEGSENPAETALSGTVKDSQTGDPIEGASVVVTALSDGRVAARGSTDSSGTFDVLVPSGRLRVAFQKDGYSSLTRTIEVPENATAESLDVALSARNLGGGSDYRAVLRWGAEPRDLDSHLIGVEPGFDYHVYSGDMQAVTASGDVRAVLDVDDVDGYGPETLTFSVLPGGTYDYFIHNYSGDYSSDRDIAGSGAKVDLYKGNTLIRTFTAPSSGDGLVWNVFEIRNGQVLRIDSLSDRDPFPAYAQARTLEDAKS